MDLTTSYQAHFSAELRARYEFHETRNAAGVLSATNPNELGELVAILEWLWLTPADLLDAGGNKSDLAKRLDERFREVGWREGRHDVTVSSVLKLMPYRPAGEAKPVIAKSEVTSEGYKVDNVKARVALDVEWNAKDGNLDRDVGAYRALYDAGIIDAGVIITRTQADLRQAVLQIDADSKKFNTTTTTNIEKLLPRMQRGDGGGCPILAIAISSRCVQ